MPLQSPGRTESCGAPARAVSGARSWELCCPRPGNAAWGAPDGTGRGLPVPLDAAACCPGSPTALGWVSECLVRRAEPPWGPHWTSTHQYSPSLRPPSSQVGFSHSCAPSAGPRPGTARAPLRHRTGIAPAPRRHRSGTGPVPLRHRSGIAPARLRHRSSTAPAPPSPWPTAVPRGQEHPAAGLRSSLQPRRGPQCQLGRGALPAAPQGPAKTHTSSETKAFLPSNSSEKRYCCNTWLW